MIIKPKAANRIQVFNQDGTAIYIDLFTVPGSMDTSFEVLIKKMKAKDEHGQHFPMDRDEVVKRFYVDGRGVMK